MNTTDIKLLVLGWFFYWLIKIRAAVQHNPKGFKCMDFLRVNTISFIMSIAATYALKLLAPTISTDIIDMRKPVTCLIAGYSSLSLIIGILNPVKNHGNPGT